MTKYCLSFKLAAATLEALEGGVNNVVICPAVIGIKRCGGEEAAVVKPFEKALVCPMLVCTMEHWVSPISRLICWFGSSGGAQPLKGP